MVAVVAEPIPPGVAPAAGITITGLGVGDSLVSVWRTADEERRPVRGYRRTIMNDAAFVEDWDVPLDRPVAYEVEVISGPSGASRTSSAPIIVEEGVDQGWIMDPLIPGTAVAITKPSQAAGRPAFAADAMKALEYSSDIALYKILGSDEPMALFGQRMRAAGVPLSMITNAAEHNSRLRKLFMSTSELLVRLPPSWQGALPGTWFTVINKISEQPVNASMGGALTLWTLTGDSVQAPTIRVLTARFTYGDVAILFSTYQQKQDAMAGKTYLDDLKNPFG